MANLRANRITSTEVFETTGSVQFDGDNDGLTISDNADFDLGTGDFTIEGWYYIQNAGAYLSLFDWRGSGGDGDYPALFRNDTGNYIYYYVNSAQRISNVTINYNTWFHVSVCRFSGITRLFIDGEEKGSFQDSFNYVSRDILLGISQSNSNDLKGHISNYRVVKGTALYTKNFTPPTRELEVIPNTVLLACQSTTKADEEKTGKTITVTGNAVANELTPGLLTNVVKSGGSSAITGSVEFDGSGDYLSLASSSDFAFGTGDFTVEFFFYSNNVRGTGGAPGQQLGFLQTSDTSGGLKTTYTSGIVIIQGSTKSSGGLNGGLVANIIGTNVGSSTAVITTGSWNHLSLTRSSGTVRLFLNGILIDSETITGSIDGNNLAVGGYYDTSYLFNGFLSNFRIIKGTALYTSNFIPPTRKLTKLPGTVLLCCQDNESVTTEVTGKTITANGDPTASDFTPSVGSDGTVEFKGPTTINTENYFYLPTGPTEQRGRGRGLIGGGVFSVNRNTIDYVTIQSTGNATDFGDLTLDRRGLGSCSSSTRGVWGGGIGGSPDTFRSTIDYVTIATTGNAQSFGNLTEALRQKTALSNSTRGIFAGGYTGPTHYNIIEYITISSTGVAKVFGELSANKSAMLPCSNSTRGLLAGGSPPATISLIEYITISSTGSSQNFGNLTVGRGYGGGCSTPIRGVFGGGTTTQTNVIDYVTIASTGNAQDFGDLSLPKSDLNALSGSNRGIFFGGYSSPNPVAVNTIDYITISSTGDYQDFGDLTLQRTQLAGCSDSHGGLG